MSDSEMSIKEPLVATTSLLFGMTVKSIDASLLTVEVIVIALIEIFPLE